MIYQLTLFWFLIFFSNNCNDQYFREIFISLITFVIPYDFQ